MTAEPGEFYDLMPLRAARNLTRDRAMNGETLACPVCVRDVTFYQRKLHSGMARALLQAARLGARYEFVKGTDTGSHEFQQLLWWDLVYADERPREDGGKRGYFRLTELGVQFIAGRARVPRKAWVFDGRRFSWVDRDDLVSFTECLGDKFDLGEVLEQVRTTWGRAA